VELDVSGSMRRPIGVWIISVWHLLLVGVTLLLIALVFSGTVKITAAQKAYYASLYDWFAGLAIGFIGLGAVVALFLLRRIAVTLFSVALVLKITLSAVQILRTNFMETVSGAALWGDVFGYLILIAVIVYARKLAKNGVLRPLTHIVITGSRRTRSAEPPFD